MYDPLDERGVPASRGVPMAVRVAASIGILAIFLVGWWTIYNAGYGHVWPSTKSLRIPLNGSFRP
jgi:hypothetical protein